MKKEPSLTERVLDRIWEVREKEHAPHLQDDLNIAWITVRWASKGIPGQLPYPGPANVAATYQVLNCHPDDVWPRILANRKARLGKEFPDWYDAVAIGNLMSPERNLQSTSQTNSRTEL